MLPHNPRTSELLETYGSALEAAKAMRDGECTTLTPQEKQRVERTRTREVRALINECQRLDIRIITLDDSEYPPQLKRIQDPPIVLFVKGNLSPMKSLPSLAVVGPRSPSEYGRNVADKLCTQLAKDSVALISGLAVGVDSIAHRCAVNNGGYTIGVMGCGLMVNYPAENNELKTAIIESGGAIISELLPYASVASNYFRRRNRIISGLGIGTLIVEAASRSGCLLTAEHTVAQGRPLMCIPPHDIFSERFSGAAALLRDGAVPVFDTADIYRQFAAAQTVSEAVTSSISRLKTQAEKPAKHPAKTAAKATPDKTETKSHTPPAPAKPERTSPDLSALSPEEASVATALQEKSMTMDELIDITGLAHDKICSIVLGLELSDIITRNQTGTFSLL